MADKNETDNKTWKEKRKEQMTKMLQSLESGVQEVFTSGKYAEYLNTMSKFHDYSLNNQLLIFMQKPEASYVAGYKAWQKMDRHVVEGTKAIKILAPCPYTVEKDKIDPVTLNLVTNDKGEVVKEKINCISFKPVNVFDISQTEGKPLPSLASDLQGDLNNFKELQAAIIATSPCPISFENFDGSAKGYCMNDGSKIVIRQGMSDTQTVKTMIHELAHRNIHCLPTGTEEKSRAQKELEAESTAYIVCRNFGIDTSEYSFGYVAGWSQGKSQEQLKESLNTIRETSEHIISSMENNLEKVHARKAAEKVQDNSATISNIVQSCKTSEAVYPMGTSRDKSR